MLTGWRSRGRILFLTLAFLSYGELGHGEQKKEADVEFVPTPHEVVTEMLKMAQVTQSDIVYDLGCGDGRIVIAAAKQCGARGVGVDIDPVLIKLCDKRAREAGVTDRVTFTLGDLFETDIRQATVVALYLTPELNLRLRSKLLADLKPGARIVSHDFDMGDWKPDQTGHMSKVHFFFPDDGPRVRDTKFYYWVIPVDVAGTWRWTLKLPSGERHYVLSLNQKFQEVSGKGMAEGRELALSELRLTGDRITFWARDEIRGQSVGMQFTGRVSGNSIEGSAQFEGGPFQGTRGWAAKHDH